MGCSTSTQRPLDKTTSAVAEKNSALPFAIIATSGSDGSSLSSNEGQSQKIGRDSTPERTDHKIRSFDCGTINSCSSSTSKNSSTPQWSLLAATGEQPTLPRTRSSVKTPIQLAERLLKSESLPTSLIPKGDRVNRSRRRQRPRNLGGDDDPKAEGNGVIGEAQPFVQGFSLVGVAFSEELAQPTDRGVAGAGCGVVAGAQVQVNSAGAVAFLFFRSCGNTKEGGSRSKDVASGAETNGARFVSRAAHEFGGQVERVLVLKFSGTDPRTRAEYFSNAFVAKALGVPTPPTTLLSRTHTTSHLKVHQQHAGNPLTTLTDVKLEAAPPPPAAVPATSIVENSLTTPHDKNDSAERCGGDGDDDNDGGEGGEEDWHGLRTEVTNLLKKEESRSPLSQHTDGGAAVVRAGVVDGDGDSCDQRCHATTTPSSSSSSSSFSLRRLCDELDLAQCCLVMGFIAQRRQQQQHDACGGNADEQQPHLEEEEEEEEEEDEEEARLNKATTPNKDNGPPAEDLRASALLQSVGAQVGRVLVLDLVLRNADRLPCAELGWRGNRNNILLCPPPSSSSSSSAPSSSLLSPFLSPSSLENVNNNDNKKRQPKNKGGGGVDADFGDDCGFVHHPHRGGSPPPPPPPPDHPPRLLIVAIDTTCPRAPPSSATKGDPEAYSNVLKCVFRSGLKAESASAARTPTPPTPASASVAVVVVEAGVELPFVKNKSAKINNKAGGEEGDDDDDADGGGTAEKKTARLLHELCFNSNSHGPFSSSKPQGSKVPPQSSSAPPPSLPLPSLPSSSSSFSSSPPSSSLSVHRRLEVEAAAAAFALSVLETTRARLPLLEHCLESSGKVLRALLGAVTKAATTAAAAAAAADTARSEVSADTKPQASTGGKDHAGAPLRLRRTKEGGGSTSVEVAHKEQEKTQDGAVGDETKVGTMLGDHDNGNGGDNGSDGVGEGGETSRKATRIRPKSRTITSSPPSSRPSSRSRKGNPSPPPPPRLRHQPPRHRSPPKVSNDRLRPFPATAITPPRHSPGHRHQARTTSTPPSSSPPSSSPPAPANSNSWSDAQPSGPQRRPFNPTPLQNTNPTAAAAVAADAVNTRRLPAPRATSRDSSSSSSSSAADTRRGNPANNRGAGRKGPSGGGMDLVRAIHDRFLQGSATSAEKEFVALWRGKFAEGAREIDYILSEGVKLASATSPATEIDVTCAVTNGFLLDDEVVSTAPPRDTSDDEKEPELERQRQQQLGLSCAESAFELHLRLKHLVPRIRLVTGILATAEQRHRPSTSSSSSSRPLCLSPALDSSKHEATDIAKGGGGGGSSSSCSSNKAGGGVDASPPSSPSVNGSPPIDGGCGAFHVRDSNTSAAHGESIAAAAAAAEKWAAHRRAVVMAAVALASQTTRVEEARDANEEEEEEESMRRKNASAGDSNHADNDGSSDDEVDLDDNNGSSCDEIDLDAAAVTFAEKKMKANTPELATTIKFTASSVDLDVSLELGSAF